MSSSLLLARFDPSLTYLASAVQALDVHQVKVQSLISSQDSVNASLSLGKNQKISNLSWVSSDSTPLVALCLTNGTIQLYSPLSNSIVAELEHPSSLQITDFHYSEFSKTAWSSDVGGNIYEWDLQSHQLLSKTALFDLLELAESVSRISSVSYDGKAHLLVGTQNVYLINPYTKTVVKTFHAHVSPIHTLMPVAGHRDLFITAADGDRFVNVYSFYKTFAKAVLVAEACIEHVGIAEHDTVGSILAAITESGSVEVFQNPLNFDNSNVTETPEKSKKKRKHAKAVSSRHSDALLKFGRPDGEITNPDDETLRINALALSSSILHVTWLENASVSYFDALPWYNDAGFTFNGTQKIAKSKQKVIATSHSTDGHDVAAPKLYQESHTVITEGNAFQDDVDEEEDEESLAEKINKLSEESRQAESRGKKKLKRHTPGSLAVVLSQALKNNDNSLLDNSVLINKDPEIVRNTIARLDPSLAVVLLDRLAERITRKQSRSESLYFWIKWVIVIHGSVLASIPNISNKLTSLHSILTKKADTLPRLLELQGRLNLLQSQNSLKKEILNGSVVQDEDGEGEVEYVEELDDAEYAGLISDDEDEDMEEMDGVDDYEESDGELENGIDQ
ncbi:hypothetical protein FT663_02432 [Candidozyma haemuli var. vulneris]|uniref:Small-subunit processome Utp12 domain-containing protein n=1 Tax=Candidozyma haemuli TaxID=45357 RepID=A0A2V1ANC5_9ASCO|nr:hypothetical protein CXQ85_001505 [[Candida] haemuloni]KAF3992115.1 hypothetical protein FT663_02432 [[Candida] haemuloni var. vulneris]KAF3992733.1 hypothetical protein FT662_00942 [[Candida] haemuloni var. vulneris]PVH19204.1 hypothetical protein CXQ85_001505 [[Candida] haemuloni]